MLRFLWLLALCVAVPAQAGIFSDDDARKQIQQLEARVQQLEDHVVKLEGQAVRLEDATKQQTRTMLDFLGQIEALNGEIRKMRGQNEELVHGLQSAEKREKDFYVDLDTRLRRFEPSEAEPQDASGAPASSDDPVAENRAIETAYGLLKGGSYANAGTALQEFIKKYPASVHLPNAYYWLGNAQFALQDYKNALLGYQYLLKEYPGMPKAADALFNIAGCQQELKLGAASQKTLKQLIAKYPDSEAAAKAKKLLSPAR